MPFVDCLPASRAAHGTELGFALRLPGSGKNVQLQIIVGPSTVRKMKWSQDSKLRLRWDRKSKLFQLEEAGTNIAKSVRHLKLADSGRGTWTIPCTGDIAEAFGTTPHGMLPLNIEEISATNGLIFSFQPEDAAGGSKDSR